MPSSDGFQARELGCLSRPPATGPSPHPCRGRTAMRALADLLARAAAQVGALEAGAPALAAAATRPLRAADLMHAGTLDLLTPLLDNELVLAVANWENSGLSLHKAGSFTGAPARESSLCWRA